MKDNSAVLTIEDVGYRTGGTTILNNVSFSLLPGEFRLITGPSGCGKSTLLKIIASLLTPTSGKIFFEGKDISTLSPEAYRQQVSYSVQTPSLFDSTVYDNLLFPWQIRHKTPDPERFSADLARFNLPPDTLTKSVSELSGGEKQRVAIARAMAKAPQLLFADEPTSALDAESGQRVIDILHRAARNHGTTVLCVSHDPRLVRHADRVLGMEDGAIRSDWRQTSPLKEKQ